MKIPGSRTIKKIKGQFYRRGLILMYHRVANLIHDPWWLSVSPSNFAEHMKVIKRYGRPVSMQKMEEGLNRLSWGGKEIVLTFDDGYADNYYNARPILECEGIPATFYVASGTIDGKEEFWWDEIGRLTLAVEKLPGTFQMMIAGKEYHWKINSGAGSGERQYLPGTYQNKPELTKAELYYALWEAISPLSFQGRKDALRQITLWAGQPPGARADFLPMTAQEISSLASTPLFEIGAHTVTHNMLSHLPSAQQQEEITRNKNHLEKIIARPVTSFSYPHGDYSEETIKIVKGSGFTNACTVESRPVKRNDSSFLLPRVMVLNWGKEEFEQNLRNWLN